MNFIVPLSILMQGIFSCRPWRPLMAFVVVGRDKGEECDGGCSNTLKRSVLNGESSSTSQVLSVDQVRGWGKWWG